MQILKTLNFFIEQHTLFVVETLKGKGWGNIGVSFPLV